ncbi:hypothetical protein JJV70_01325 [Streptomyces sp. JJ66]|nr:hypothetical protein [Streptomyces sp. JJ66]
MWACQECTDRYRVMKDTQEASEEYARQCGPGVDTDPLDSVVSSQIRLARHLADAHGDHLPGWDPACSVCASHQKSIAREEREAERSEDGELRVAAMVRLGGEHRARHVFAPPSVVQVY